MNAGLVEARVSGTTTIVICTHARTHATGWYLVDVVVAVLIVVGVVDEHAQNLRCLSSSMMMNVRRLALRVGRALCVVCVYVCMCVCVCRACRARCARRAPVLSYPRGLALFRLLYVELLAQKGGVEPSLELDQPIVGFGLGHVAHDLSKNEIDSTLITTTKE